jgi:ferric-dicitrate binding protein FerR (iron transport regulator)
MQPGFKALLDRYRSGTATEQDVAFLEAWYLKYRDDSENNYAPADQLADALAVWEGLDAVRPAAKSVRLWSQIAAAASILLCLSIGGYFLSHKRSGQVASFNAPIGPAGNRATLRFANGTRLLLENIKTGSSIQQPDAIIQKISDGALLYKQQPRSGQRPLYDTLTTPRGGHYQVVLPDGTKAWLNAATVIRYPESFSGKERQIELVRGEAYFEVAHNKRKPFRVISKGQVVEDIGTHFNVKAYEDEPAIETTLIEGSISVTGNRQRVILVPGQRSFLKKGSPMLVSTANLEEAVAWKDNHFIFNDDNVESIMRQISRWYDIDVSYEGDLSGVEITGSISRSENVAEVLRKLEETGTVHFNLQGRKVIVMP